MNLPPILVVTADDFGVEHRRDEGIVQLIRRGVITSVSLTANGSQFDRAVRTLTELAADLRPSIGLHVNLSEGQSLRGACEPLTDSAGRFLGKQSTMELTGWCCRNDSMVRNAVLRELRAQADRILASGLTIDHINGHHHVHVLPSVAALVAELAASLDIRWIRVPDEPLPPAWDPSCDGDTLREAQVFSSRAARVRDLFTAVARVPHFHGLTLKGRWGRFVDSLINSIKGGVHELMVHPGYATRPELVPSGWNAAFFGLDRERELKGLLGAPFERSLRARGVELRGFP